MHLDFHETVALARLASPALYVERESSWPVAADFRLGQFGEQFADRCEQTGVRRRIRPRRPTDRALIDVDDLVDVLESGDARVRTGYDPSAIEMTRQCAMQDV